MMLYSCVSDLSNLLTNFCDMNATFASQAKRKLEMDSPSHQRSTRRRLSSACSSVGGEEQSEYQLYSNPTKFHT